MENNECIEPDDEDTGLEEKLAIMLGIDYDGYLQGDTPMEFLIDCVKKYKAH
jgi:hypothetical protein